MKYCSKCGKELMDEALICPGCGCPTSLYYQQQQQQNQQSYEQPAQNTVQATTNIYCILSLIFAFIMPILGIIFGAIGVKQVKENDKEKGEQLGKAGLGISIAFLVLGILIMILVFVLVAIFGTSDYNPNDPNYPYYTSLVLQLLS